MDSFSLMLITIKKRAQSWSGEKGQGSNKVLGAETAKKKSDIHNLNSQKAAAAAALTEYFSAAASDHL